MSKKLENAYAVLRAKDEVEANKNHFLSPALVIFILGIFSLHARAWWAAAMAIAVAAVLAVGPRIVCFVLNRTIKKLGYSEVELERAGLA